MLTSEPRWHTDWFLSAILNAHIDAMVNRYSALLALRTDLYYRKGTSHFLQPDHRQMESDIRTLMEIMSRLRPVVGYFWVIEYAPDRRYHAHVVFWLDRHKTQRPYPFAEKAGKYWRDITYQQGSIYRSVFKEHYKANIHRPVYYNDPASIENIRQTLSYLAKEEQKDGFYLYGCNDVPVHSERGRPRASGERRQQATLIPPIRYGL
ncbi:inovirus-type Gp2 protein [Salmonella enterica]|nr:inovirus-type Gp2 protein [Salmonella enterica]EKT1626072.1 inovirus-type Gp2 protein [Salmonella enterica]